MKYKYIISLLISNILLFYIGLNSGKYIQSIKIENAYPFYLREIFVNNQPTCDTYKIFMESNISVDSSVITNNKGEKFVRVISLQKKEKDIKFIVSILNQAQEQFVDEVWLECKPVIK